MTETPREQTTAIFAFSPTQRVRLCAYGLGYPGRVLSCLLHPHNRLIYDVEYAANGEIRRGHFSADELEDAV